jgi:hypothetical protein
MTTNTSVPQSPKAATADRKSATVQPLRSTRRRKATSRVDMRRVTRRVAEIRRTHSYEAILALCDELV